MSPLRIAFLLVFVAAAAAFLIARSAVTSFSIAPQEAEGTLPTPKKSTATPRPSPRPTRPAPPTATPRPTTAAPPPTRTPMPATAIPATPVHATPTRAAAVRATPVPTQTQRPRRPRAHVAAHAPRAHSPHTGHGSHGRRRRRLRLVPTPRPTPRPSPTALSGTTTLTNYWISRTAASRGATLAVGYTIDNGTGRTERVMLGASIKPTSVLTWGRSISDPFHDVVATVPPGVSTHVRYFTLADGLRPGRYDVAWGLRNAATGVPVALVSAPLSLRVMR